MSDTLPTVYLARHGETAWSLTGQHTGLSDIPLTPRGEQNARRLGDRLKGPQFSHVFVSSLVRARRTADLAGFAERAVVDPELVEWDYGQYEGKTTSEIRRENPDWQLFRDGSPGGESVADVAARADRVIARLRKLDANSLVFSSGHFLRMLGARWCGLEPLYGRILHLDTAALSIVGYEHDRDEPIIQLWNDCGHARD